MADTFAYYAPALGWPVVSGPYLPIVQEPDRRVWKRRDDWWGAKIGFRDLPKVEYLVYQDEMNETKRVQNLLANQVDLTLDLRPQNMEAVLEQNPKVTTWTGRKPPYGYVNFWPISLALMGELFDDVEIRQAINYAINRPQVVKFAWQDTSGYTLLPFPDFPPMRRFTDQIQDLVAQYEIGVHDPAKTAAILKAKGWSRDDWGVWTKDGERLRFNLYIPARSTSTFLDLGMIIVSQLTVAGFDAHTYIADQADTTKPYMFFAGHAGGVRDPYYTLNLYRANKTESGLGGTLTGNRWDWSHPDFDALVDQLAQTPPDAPEYIPLFRQAMEIWLRELPALPIVQWYHRNPHNQSRWTNWPSQEEPVFP